MGVGFGVASRHDRTQGVGDRDVHTVGVVVAEKPHMSLRGDGGVIRSQEVNGIRVQMGVCCKADMVFSCEISEYAYPASLYNIGVRLI